MFHFVEQALHSIRKRLVTPILCMPLMHPRAFLVGTVVIIVHKVHSWVRLLMIFLPLVACITPSRTTSSSQKGGNIPVSSSLISLCLMVKVSHAFSNRFLPLSYDRQPKAMTILEPYGLVPPRCLWPTTSGGASHIWHWAFHLVAYGFWDEHYTWVGGVPLS